MSRLPFGASNATDAASGVAGAVRSGVQHGSSPTNAGTICPSRSWSYPVYATLRIDGVTPVLEPFVFLHRNDNYQRASVRPDHR